MVTIAQCKAGPGRFQPARIGKNIAYHFSVQPGGGKISHCDEPNDSAAMKKNRQQKESRGQRR
jgi:hypothetical protein